MSTWKHGQKAQLAKAAGIRPQFFNDILSRRRKCPPRAAIELEDASTGILGYKVSAVDWLQNQQSPHPIFQPLEVNNA